MTKSDLSCVKCKRNFKDFKFFFTDNTIHWRTIKGKKLPFCSYCLSDSNILYWRAEKWKKKEARRSKKRYWDIVQLFRSRKPCRNGFHVHYYKRIHKNRGRLPSKDYVWELIRTRYLHKYKKGIAKYKNKCYHFALRRYVFTPNERRTGNLVFVKRYKLRVYPPKLVIKMNRKYDSFYSNF